MPLASLGMLSSTKAVLWKSIFTEPVRACKDLRSNATISPLSVVPRPLVMASLTWNGTLLLSPPRVHQKVTLHQSRCRPLSRPARSAISAPPSRCPHQFFMKCLVGASAALSLSTLLLTAPSHADFLSYDHADMRGADLSGKDLTGAVFAACDCRLINLEGSNLDSTTVTFAGFQGANLQNTSWIRSLADRVVFREANLKNANFTNAILSGSQFDGAEITGADFTDSIIDKSQRLKMCKKAKGTNPVTGMDTRESLLC